MLSCLTEFNEEAFRKDVHKEGFLDAVIKFIDKHRNKNISKDDIINQVTEYFDLSLKDATNLVNEH